MARRQRWIATVLVASAMVLSPAGIGAEGTDPWQQVPAILARITPPKFPSKVCDITSYGAVADERSVATASIRAAIGACSAAGGGRVVVPAGTFLTGPIHLRSNIELHLAKGARLRFVAYPGAYEPLVRTRFEGTDCYNYSPFIYAYEQENLAITGEGVIDGQGAHAAWEAVRRLGRGRIREMGNDGVPVEERRFGTGYGLRPSMVQFYRSKNVLLDGVTFVNAPMWAIHTVLSDNITVTNITVENGAVNGDGLDLESCRGVLVRKCVFRTRDDAIALKSGRDGDGRRIGVPIQDVVIQDVAIQGLGNDPRNGFAIGSEISGGARNVFVENMRIEGRVRGIALKSNSRRGGTIERIYLRKVTLHRIKDPVLHVDLDYRNETGAFPPTVRDVELRDFSGQDVGSLVALEVPLGATVERVVIRDGSLENVRMADGWDRETHGVKIIGVTVTKHR